MSISERIAELAYLAERAAASTRPNSARLEVKLTPDLSRITLIIHVDSNVAAGWLNLDAGQVDELLTVLSDFRRLMT
jgi:hypothetical protein